MKTRKSQLSHLIIICSALSALFAFSAKQVFAYDNPSGSSASDVFTLDATINNAGSITGEDAIQSAGTGVVVINSGSMVGTSKGFFNVGGDITSLTNSGLIQSTTDTAVLNGYWTNGSLGTLINAATGQIIGAQVGIWNNSPMTNLINSGLIEGTGTQGIVIYASPISNITNNASGSIIGANAIYIGGGRAVNSITNEGVISGTSGDGIVLAGGNTTIGTLTSIGTISSVGGYGINNAGAIANLVNGQGAGNSAGALTYTGNLPTNYNIIINSPTSFGKLAVTSGTGLTSFGVYTGSTVLGGHTYAAVLSGIGSSNLNSLSGSYGGLNWLLSPESACTTDCVYDLVFVLGATGPSTANTQQSLVNTSTALQGTFALQNSVLANSFSYDCTEFGANGVCISAGGRNTAVSAANGLNNTSGLLIAAYRPHPNYRIGAYADQNLSVNNAGSTVNLGNNTPLIGLFGAWNERLDGTGAEVKVSAAYGQKNTTVNRSVVGSGASASEAGSGSSALNSQGAQVTAKYGFAVTEKAIIAPYVGMRYTQNNMGGYTEGASAAVTAPLTYSALNTNATTALAGVGASYKVIPTVTTYASAGVESDTNTANGTYSASGVTGLTPINFNPNPVRTRPTATIGAYYDIEKNQRIGVTGIYRQEPYQAVSTTTVMATYTVGL